MNNRRLIIMIFNCIMIITAITLTIMFGILGYGRPHGLQDIWQYDFDLLYSVGKAWLSGLNPYVDPVSNPDHLFAYPPNSSFFYMLLSVTTLDTSKILLLFLNISCITMFVYICIRLYNLYNISNDKHFFLFDFKSSLLISMIVGNVAIANILWMGQTTILFFTALLASYYFYLRSNEVRSGILLAVALMKPQLAYAFLLWFILERKWKTLAVAACGTVIFGIVPIYNRGIITSVCDWIQALNPYLQVTNGSDWWWRNHLGVSPLLQNLGIEVSEPIILFCSILLIIAIHHYYIDINKLKLLGILAIVELLLGRVQQYDVMIATTVLPYYLINIKVQDFNKFILLLLTFIMINFPRKLLLLSDYRILHHHREIILIIVLLSLLFWREDQPGSGLPTPSH